MRLRVTNSTPEPVARGGRVFRGESTSEVTVTDKYRLAEIKACRFLQVVSLDEPESKPGPVDLESMTREQLREKAKELNVPSVYKLQTRSTLIEAIKKVV